MRDVPPVDALIPERWAHQAWKPVVVGLVVVGGLWTATHGVAGVQWSDVATALGAVTLRQVVLLAGIWVAGLAIYATVLSAALPGLGVRRGLLLNLSGSAIANSLPLGGAVATGMNWRMVRRWGHSNLSFASFCVLTNALDVLTKLVLPLVAVGAFAALSMPVPASLRVLAALCAGALVQAVAAQALLLRAPSRARPSGASGRAVLRVQVRATAVRARRQLVRQWHRLLPASAAYVAAQVLLLLVSLHAVGLTPPLVVVLTAAAIERVGSLVAVTPGGVGVAEIGTVAWLVASGLDPVGVVSGVLLYRFFLIAMEIPVGGVLLGGWALLQRRPRTERVDA